MDQESKQAYANLKYIRNLLNVDGVMTAFCDVAPCSPMKVERRFRGAYCLHHQGDGSAFYFHRTKRRYISESCHFHTGCREGLKHHLGCEILQIKDTHLYINIT
jgi:hypothetical protein